MRILALWVVNYQSGCTSERFIKPLEALGASVDVIPLEEPNVESKLIKAVKTGNYDLLLHLPYPGKVRLEVIKSLPIMTLAWNGDDEWYWNTHNKFAKDIADSHEYCVTTYKPALSFYKRGILGSWGYSSDWKPKKIKKDIDIYFCGGKTDIRDMYLKRLIDDGFKVVIDGPGYSGKVPLQTMIDRYRRAKIGLSFVSENKNDYYYQQIKARTFEIPAVGTFQLSEYCDEIKGLFRKDEIATFVSDADLSRLCKYYLRHEAERERIAKNGLKRSKEYSYEKIFKRIFKRIESDYV
jgi:hypothetical protein